MRPLLLLALIAAPAAALPAQYPAPGNYKTVVQPIGQDGQIPLTMSVRTANDSTELGISQGNGGLIPIADVRRIPTGFHLVIAGSLYCDVLKGEKGWGGLCSDKWGGPQFTLHVPPTPEPDSTAAP